jgi:asparagine synthase (glutamine-hydrolysing)
MCGILGYFSTTVAVDEQRFAAALTLLKHRGPDGSNTWSNGKVALGHTRLSIIDLSDKGLQPFSNSSGTVIAVVNGEFYGYQEIRQELIDQGHQFTSECDSEILIHLYEQYGIKAINYLNGEWAFLLYDLKKNTLYAARDPFGVKPLYYYQANNGIYFSSEIKSFKALCDLKLKRDLFADFNFSTNKTSFENVYHVMPGTIQITNSQGTHSHRYYHHKFYPKDSSEKHREENEYKTELLERLKHAVKIRLQADVPVGIYLSGGVDSVIILALASQYLKDIHTFSITFPDDPDSDESQFINLTLDFYRAQGCQIYHHEVAYDHEQALKQKSLAVWTTESLTTDAIVQSQIQLSKLVHDCGFKVVLTGQGSDEILGGYPTMLQDLGYTPKRQKNFPNPMAILKGRLLKFMFDYFRCYLKVFRELPYFPTFLKISLIIAHRKLVLESLDYLAKFTNWNDKEPLALSSFVDISKMFKTVLNMRGDRVEMANSVEGRLPFLDKDFVNFTCTIPQHLKINQGREKYILYEAVKDIIPPEIYQRQKHIFIGKISPTVGDDDIVFLKTLITKQTEQITEPKFQATLKKIKQNQSINTFEFDLVFNALLLQQLFTNPPD